MEVRPSAAPCLQSILKLEQLQSWLPGAAARKPALLKSTVCIIFHAKLRLACVLDAQTLHFLWRQPTRPSLRSTCR